MKKSLTSLGKTLTKAEQKEIKGASIFDGSDLIDGPIIQCACASFSNGNLTFDRVGCDSICPDGSQPFRL